ncbi:hypothetical protein [Actinoplanes sp. NPDC049118]|uniref:hypothetical protein n=1 Tax=Actinoplanes sp. NPDC049118 TaxID=3155769 RepID=UPI0033DEF429
MGDAIRKVMIGDVVLMLFLGAEDDERTVDNLDVQVNYPDGARYSASIMTIVAVQRIMRNHETSGESLGGRYFKAHDLVIVQRGGVVEIVDLVRGLIEANEVSYTFDDIGPED